MLSDNFAAIDFETADEKRDSACAVSVVIVKRGVVAKQITHLIRPPCNRFSFTDIHGIRWVDVADKPTFGQLWPQILPFLDSSDFIAAHNATFDKSVLLACCLKASLKPPRIPFICTVELARKVWNIYPTKLPDVCNRLSISLDHHNAASDALACASIVLAAKANAH